MGGIKVTAERATNCASEDADLMCDVTVSRYISPWKVLDEEAEASDWRRSRRLNMVNAETGPVDIAEMPNAKRTKQET